MELVTGHAGFNHITAKQVSRLLRGVTATDDSTVQRLNVGNDAAITYSGITMSIASGELLLDGYHVTLVDDTGGASGETLIFDATLESTNSRIDKVVLEIIQDNTTSYQRAEIVIVQGEEAESPVAPATPTESDSSTEEFLAVGVIAQVTIMAYAITEFNDLTNLYGGNYVEYTKFEDTISDLVNVYGAKNLIPYPYYSHTGTSHGITYTVNIDDGSVTASGTSTGNSRFYLTSNASTAILSTLDYLEEGKTYTLSSGVDSSSSSYWIEFALYNTSASRWEVYRTNNASGSVTFTMPSDFSIYSWANFYINFNTGATISNLTFYPMLRLASDTDDTYQPYAMTNKKLTEVAREVPYYATSSTAASTTAKVATTNQSGFALVTGAKVIVKFTYTNTATAPTLNVNETGSKTIYGYGTTTPSLWWLAGDVVEFTYDGTNWLMQPTQGQITTINSNLTDITPVLVTFDTVSLTINAASAKVTDLYDASDLISEGYTILSITLTSDLDYIISGFRINSNKIRASFYNAYSSSQSPNVGGFLICAKI